MPAQVHRSDEVHVGFSWRKASFAQHAERRITIEEHRVPGAEVTACPGPALEVEQLAMHLENVDVGTVAPLRRDADAPRPPLTAHRLVANLRGGKQLASNDPHIRPLGCTARREVDDQSCLLQVAALLVPPLVPSPGCSVAMHSFPRLSRSSRREGMRER